MDSFLNRLQHWMVLQTYRIPGGARRARRLVKAGYDQMADGYAEWARSAESNQKRDRWVAALTAGLPVGTALLDLGCGPGQEMAGWDRAGMKVTGLDISPANLALARKHAPGATLACADMTQQFFAPQSFDVVVAFYSLIHLPRRQQIQLLQRAHVWLKPGGLFLANVAARPFPAMYDGNWLGVPMFWSSLGVHRTASVLNEVGFTLLRSELATEIDFGRQNTFFWFVAQKRTAIVESTDCKPMLLEALARNDPAGEQGIAEKAVPHG